METDSMISLIVLKSPELVVAYRHLDTFGNCPRPVFSLGVSQHMYKITTVHLA